MRLLRVDDLRFEDVPSNGSSPEYAILSHTWIHPSTNEVSLQDMLDYENTKEMLLQRLGWTKLRYTVDQAKRSGLRYVWIDTCCIDQRNPTELTESINCMFEWYSRATVCYVYLSDVDLVVERDSYYRYSTETFAALLRAFKSSKWIQRGWTLQELIAPKRILFFNKHWSFLKGSAESSTLLAEATGIDADMLAHKRQLYSYSIAQRMSWAANRRTTFPEDRAYSLVGLFGITMATHYGEGEQRAFQRLQEEIVKISTDQSLFAWHGRNDSLLAPSPGYFRGRGHIVPRRGGEPVSYHLDNIGLQIKLCTGRNFAMLDCRSLNDPSEVFLLRLRQDPSGHFMIDPGRRCEDIDWRALHQRERQSGFPRKSISIRKSAATYDWSDSGRICDGKNAWHLKLRLHNPDDEELNILNISEVVPAKDWIHTSRNSLYYKPSSIWKADGPIHGAAVRIRWRVAVQKTEGGYESWRYVVIAFAYGERGLGTGSTHTPLPALHVVGLNEHETMQKARLHVKNVLRSRRTGLFERLPLTRSFWYRQEARYGGKRIKGPWLRNWQQLHVSMDRTEIAGETFWELDVALPRDTDVLYMVASKVHSGIVRPLLGMLLSTPDQVHWCLQLCLHWMSYWLAELACWLPLGTMVLGLLQLSPTFAAFAFAVEFLVHSTSLKWDPYNVVLAQVVLFQFGQFLVEMPVFRRAWSWIQFFAGGIPRVVHWVPQIWRWSSAFAWWAISWAYKPETGFTLLGSLFLLVNNVVFIHLNFGDLRAIAKKAERW